MNKLKPGAIPKIHTTGNVMKLRENAGFFQDAALAYGVGKNDVFQAVDLFDKKNIAQVTVSFVFRSFVSNVSSSSVVHLRAEPSRSKEQFQRTEIELSNEITRLRLIEELPFFRFALLRKVFTRLSFISNSE